MAKRTFQRNPKTEAARAKLIIMSQQANDQKELLEAQAGDCLSINDILLMFHKAATGREDFRRFDQWKEAGYKVKKGETGYRVWGSPVKAKKTANGESFDESAEATAEENVAKKYKFWPMCSLFHEGQVEPMDRDTGTDDQAETTTKPTPAKLETVTDTAGILPAGWSESAPGRMATNPNPARGGIIDQESATGEWFIVFNDVTRQNLEGFATRAEAFAAWTKATEAPANDIEPVSVAESMEWVPVAEYRRRVEHLERVYNGDRHSCVGAGEWECWRRIAVRVLGEVERTECKRAKDEDRIRKADIVNRVRFYLNDNPTPPPSHRRQDNGTDSEHKGIQAESQAPAANDTINQRRDDLGNNESVSRGLFPEADGSFTAMTATESKPFKTESGAAQWLARRGLQPNGERLPESVEPAPAPAAGNAKTAAKLREIADKQTSKIDDCFAERLENTPKRRAQAARKRQDGQHIKRTQAALYALAERHDAGTVPAELANVKTLKAISQLMAAKMEPVENGFHCYHVELDEPATDTPETRAAWALIAPKSEAEQKAEQLAEKTGALMFANIPGYFPTPAPAADSLIEWAQIEDGHTVADTSAGSGHLLDRITAAYDVSVTAYERHYSLTEILGLKGYSVNAGDFLQEVPAPRYDRIVINPPFEQLQDIDHVRHSYEFLKPGGRLVAIMAPGAFFRDTKKAQDFRAWFEALGGEKEDMPEGSFKASGTGVSTVRVAIDKPERASGFDPEQDEAPSEAGEGAREGEATASPFVNSSYADDLEERRAHREDRARRAQRQAEQLAATARKMGDVIPFGQPILVGHHSERGDRAYRNRIIAKTEKACQAFDKADYHQGKAASIGTGGIASNDPEALAKLREQLAERERQQATMKAANRAIRANDDKALAALGFSDAEVAELKKGDSVGRVGFADFQLTNNNAQIRRLKGRIEELEDLYQCEPIEHEHEDFAVEVSEGRVAVDFTAGKPCQEAREIVKRNGFRFSRRLGNLWTRKATHNGIGAAHLVIEQLEALERIY